MKLKEIYEELIEIAKQAGIKVRKENGKFHSGSCVVKEESVIILNRTTTLETMTGVLAKGLSDKQIDKIYIKPAVREYIDREKGFAALQEKSFSLEVEY
jgi:hypothetical protein